MYELGSFHGGLILDSYILRTWNKALASHFGRENEDDRLLIDFRSAY
jgi:hypothetical protein